MWPTSRSLPLFNGDRKGAGISGGSKDFFVGAMMVPPDAYTVNCQLLMRLLKLFSASIRTRFSAKLLKLVKNP